jgi:uroporphyrinogen-III synthase
VRSMPTSGSHGFLLVGLRIGIVGPPTASSLRNFVIRADLMTHGSSHPTPSAACTFGEKTGEKNPGCQPCSKEKPPIYGGFGSG